MSQTSTPRVLIVANRTAATEPLLHAVGARAAAGTAEFFLLVPATPRGLHRVVDPEDTGREEAQARLQLALGLFAQITGTDVDGGVGVADPMAAVSDAMHERRFDEIIISTLPGRLSRWMRIDLPSKVRAFGLPVTHVSPDAMPAAARACERAA